MTRPRLCPLWTPALWPRTTPRRVGTLLRSGRERGSEHRIELESHADRERASDQTTLPALPDCASSVPILRYRSRMSTSPHDPFASLPIGEPSADESPAVVDAKEESGAVLPLDADAPMGLPTPLLPNRPPSPATLPPHPPTLLATLAAYLRASVDVMRLRAPTWSQLPEARPMLVLLVCVFALAVECLMGWVSTPGSATFYAQALTSRWFSVCAALLACWAVCFGESRRPAQASVTADIDDGHPDAGKARGTADVFVLLMLAGSLIVIVASLAYTLPLNLGAFGDGESWTLLLTVQWLLWLCIALWSFCMCVRLLMRVTRSHAGSTLALLVLMAMFAIELWQPPPQFWYADESETTDSARASRADKSYLKPANLMQQAGTLDVALAALPAQRPGVVDTYVITYAPYAGEDVFLKEGEVVTRVMAERFGTGARSLRLTNHRSTVATLPWATPENLKNALDHIGKLIDPAEDMVFIHFASHGGSDGKLATEFFPFQMDALAATEVRHALDAANIPVRVISVSACFSGAWIAPLRTEGTLVMTASDADHTSYGCGHKSDLTYFTRAVFAEQLATKTRSFEQAFNDARPIIQAREIEGKKKDGFSNPQIYVGDIAKARLRRWLGELEAGATRD